MVFPREMQYNNFFLIPCQNASKFIFQLNLRFFTIRKNIDRNVRIFIKAVGFLNIFLIHRRCFLFLVTFFAYTLCICYL